MTERGLGFYLSNENSKAVANNKRTWSVKVVDESDLRYGTLAILKDWLSDHGLQFDVKRVAGEMTEITVVTKTGKQEGKNVEQKNFEFLNVLQTEVAEWADYNFPNSLAWRPLMGIVEEVGEFSDAAFNYDKEALFDAIGDIVVYAAHYCELMGWSLEAVFVDSPTEKTTRSLGSHLGRLSHHHLKGDQKIRGSADEHRRGGQRALGRILTHLYRRCVDRGWNLEGIVMKETWAKVKQRDWQKNPDGPSKDLA